jgi:hypothetical protein
MCTALCLRASDGDDDDGDDNDDGDDDGNNDDVYLKKITTRGVTKFNPIKMQTSQRHK